MKTRNKFYPGWGMAEEWYSPITECWYHLRWVYFTNRMTEE